MEKLFTIKEQLATLNTVMDLMNFFEIDCEQAFIDCYGERLLKRFSGAILIKKPNDWFEYRRLLKNEYCRINRSLRPKDGRSACRGCLSCERR